MEEASMKILVLEKQIEETKNRELQTRQANKVCVPSTLVMTIANIRYIFSLVS